MDKMEKEELYKKDPEAKLAKIQFNFFKEQQLPLEQVMEMAEEGELDTRRKFRLVYDCDEIGRFYNVSLSEKTAIFHKDNMDTGFIHLNSPDLTRIDFTNFLLRKYGKGWFIYEDK